MPTLSGHKRVKVPPGMASGGKIRLRGFGVAVGGKKGDLYAVIEVKVPTALNEDQKKQLEELRDLGL